MALKYSMVLQAVDRVTAPAKRMRDSMRRLGDSARKLARDFRDPDKAEEMGARLGTKLRGVIVRLASGFAIAGRAARNAAGRAGMGALALGIRGVGSAAASAINFVKRWGALGIGAAGSFLTYDLFRTAGQFEQYQAMLNRDMGSDRGKKAMAWIQNFAAETPYELDQVTGAFVQLRNYGIDAMDGSLRSAGDAAAAMNRELMDGVEALSDAMTGEFERLKGFGITASVAGKNVTLSWTKDGKQLTRTVKKNAVDMRKAVTEIWDQKFGGAMIDQSKTLFGIISNLKDAWSRFQLMIAQAGIFDRVKERLQGILETANKMSQDGRLQQWAKRISDFMESAFDWGWRFANKVDWPAVGLGLASAVSALTEIVELIGKAIGMVARFKAQSQINALKSVENGWFTSPEAKAKAKAERQNLERLLGNGSGNAGGDGKSRKSFRRYQPGDFQLDRWNNNGAGPRAPGRGGKLPGDVKASGKIEVSIKVDGQAKARVTNIAQTGDVPIGASVGPVMAGAA